MLHAEAGDSCVSLDSNRGVVVKEPNAAEITLVLGDLARGDESAAERLLPLVYAELRALAGSYFRRQGADHTLQPTALVHEAYMKMVDQTNPVLNDRAHFFAVAATAMRQILADHARRRNADKRGGGWRRVSVDSHVTPVTTSADVDLEKLDEALSKLERLDARKHRVVTFRFFSGMTVEDIAVILGVSKSTVEEDWRFARAWLSRELIEG